MLCKYWARLARHVSPCVHRAFTVFNGWNVGGESGSLLVFLFWFDQLLSITDIGNYPQKRREGRKKLAIIIFILSVMVFSYIEKNIVLNCVTHQVLIFQCPWLVYFTQIFFKTLIKSMFTQYTGFPFYFVLRSLLFCFSSHLNSSLTILPPLNI